MQEELSFSQLPVIGRDEVLETLLSHVGAARDGHGRTLWLQGPRGVGKTHLCRCILGEAEPRGFSVATGRAFKAESWVPFSLLSDAFLPLLRSLPPESLNVLTRGGAPDLEHLFPGLIQDRGAATHEDSADSMDIRARALWTFSGLLQGLSEREPLLVLLEDLQWADPSSLKAVHFLARRLHDCPVLLLLTRDQNPAEDNPDLEEVQRSLVREEVALSISLPPLTRADTGQFLHKAFGADEAAVAPFADRLHAWTEGNPFFLEETLRTLIASGRLYRKAGRWLGWEVREMELPKGVRQAVRARFDRLPQSARDLAELAAILGTRAPFKLLRVLSPMEESDLLDLLALLVSRDVLAEVMGEDGVAYDFRQTMVRETILLNMGMAKTRTLHGRVARALEEHFGERAPEHAGTLAYHHLESGQEGNASTLLFLALAGRAAMERFGDAEAAPYLQAALELWDRLASRGETLPTLDGGRRGLLRDLATALNRVGKSGEALERWRDALEQAERDAADLDTGEALADAARCRLQMGLIRNSQGDPAGALEEYETVLDSPAGELAPELPARARLLRAIVLAELGDVTEAEEELNAILEISGGLADPGIPAEAHRVLANLHTWTGHPDRVRAHAKRAAELARDSGIRSVEFWGTWAEATLEGLLGNTAEMAQRLREADAIAREIRSPVLGLRTTELAIELAAALGEWEKGLALGEQAIALARTFSQHTLLPRVLVWTSLLYLGRGDAESARPLLKEAWNASGAGGKGVFNLHGAIPAHIGMGFLALNQGDIPEAIRVGRAGLAMADSVGYGIWSLHRLIPLLAEAYLRARDLDRARAMGDRLREGAAPIGSRLGLARAQAVDALCTLLSGDLEAGIGQVEEAARALEEIPMVAEAVQLRRLKAESLAELGDRKAALAELTGVHETLLMLGAIKELEKTRETFRALDARPPRKAVGGEGDLSVREVEISRLVESRKSNKAIARELGISPRTVSTHLSNIYQKLGIGSRGELADYVRSQVLSEGQA